MATQTDVASRTSWLPLVALALAQFVMVLDQSAMNVSISTLVDDFDTTVTTIQAVITFYCLVMAMFMMTGAKVQRGSRFFVDFDIDHTMMTHARRVELIQFTETNPRFQGRTFSRQEFRDIYHDSLRLQCPACNRSHRFEPSSWDEAVYTWVFASERIPYFAPY